ncbi:MAG: D-alanyl-D-alanine carboxypeptidase [Fimbriimonadaceae bacterium]|nr:D-alanyl-D-alanine carboxypeptidase [Chthonomonadaceae bacterium]MCO5295978.1 D-alanyl-D-alanine carboxypeptidase [Fimbriimonadaceae bacterium]
MRSPIPRAIVCSVLAGSVCLAGAFDITAKRGVILDDATGKVLWEKDADTPAFPASTTKIMTAMLLIERAKPDEIIVAPPDTEEVTGSSMHLRPGERVRARDLLSAILLRSANDGAHAVAVHLAGSDLEFAKLMNERAKAIGCTHTHFHNPHGLNDDEHTVSARDLGLIAREAMKYPAFREVVSHRAVTIERSMNLEDRVMVSRNKALRQDPTIDGIKTGYTVPAGHCFVGSATRGGRRVITVILDSADWQEDNRQMLDWAFAQTELREVAGPGTTVGRVAVVGGNTATVAAAPQHPVVHAEAKGSLQPASIRLLPRNELRAPIRKGDLLGQAEFRDADGFIQHVPIVAAEDLKRRPWLQALAANVGPFAPWMAFAGVAGYAVRRRRTVRRSKSRRSQHAR